MSVITFSRHFQSTHPRIGQPTFFVEKIWKGLWDMSSAKGFSPYLAEYQQKHDNHFGNDQIVNVHQFEPKWHTIRSGSRFKVGDYFDPRVWSGKPYRSPQIQIAPTIEVKKVWNFKMDERGFYWINGYNAGFDIEEVAKNDGLTIDDFDFWFRGSKAFDGQIICWNENIEYV